MSRSFKKVPSYKDCRSGKKAKQCANRYLRRTRKLMEVGQRCHYKRFYDSWFIYDYRYKYVVMYKHTTWTKYNCTEEDYISSMKKWSRK